MSSNLTEKTPRWLNTEQARAHAGNVSAKTLYSAVAAKRLRAACIGGRGYRFKVEWVDAWLEATAEPVEVRR